MEKGTVKRRIFLSNMWMVLVILLVFLAINLTVVKVYAESIEREFQNSAMEMLDEDELTDMLKSYTLHRNEFFLLVLADGALMIAVLFGVSFFFTGRLARHITDPLDRLTDGARRIRENDLTRNVEYTGDTEFETVCDAFNQMQGHLLEEQEKSRRYEKARTDMIAGISHDLRTPLTAIKDTIKGLLDGVAREPGQQERFLKAAYRRTGEMDALLKQLFYLSGLETGNMPLSMEAVDIDGFIRNYAERRRELLEDEKTEIAVESDCSGAQVSADPEQLTRILDNLLENSRKYAQAEPLRIWIGLTAVEKNVEIRFSDNGVGVPEEALPCLFDEFYRVDESRNRKEGNGLGLYIVKYLAEAMGGSVRAERDGGLAICIRLQVSVAEAEE